MRLKSVAIAFLMIITCRELQAQSLQGDALRDSLLQSLSKEKNDTIKAKALYRLSRIYAVSDSAIAFRYANECFSLSKKDNWQKGIGLSYFAKAVILQNLTEYNSSISYSTIAYKIFKSINSKKEIGATLSNIGNCYEGLGYYANAINKHLAALKIFESIQDSGNVSVCYNNIGVNYYYLREYDKAINYYAKSLIIYTNKIDIFGIGSDLDNIAIVYLDEGKYDSANIYDLKAIPYFIRSGNLPGLGRIYGNRGNILMKLNNADSAYYYYQQAFIINKKLNVIDGLATNYGNFGELYLDVASDSSKSLLVASFMKKSKSVLLDSAKYFLAKAVDADKQEGDLESLMNHYQLLSETDEKLGNYSDALANHKFYSLYKDSIFNDENKKKIEAMETERLTEAKDQQIALQTSEVKRQTLLKNIILISVVALAALVFVFIILYNKRKKSQFDKKVMDVEMKALRAQMNPHFIFNSLHSISRYVMENDKENTLEYLSKFANLMRLTLENSREQEVSLEKDLEALELYIQLEALRFKNSFSYSIEVDPQLDAEDTLIPPLLLQPFVENAIIHGVQDNENGLINISIKKEKNEMICCVIEDNGNGTNKSLMPEVSEQKKHKSLGKKIINERLNIINQIKKVKASVNIFDKKIIDSNSSGMRVELLLPLELAF